MSDNFNNLLYKKITELTAIATGSIDKLFEIADEHQYKKGEIILKEGQICKNVMFVERGYLRTYMIKEGLEINTEFTFEGNFTTNLKSLRTTTGSEMIIQAGEPTTLYLLDKDKLLDLYKLSAEIESFGRKLLEELLIAKEEQTNLFKFSSAAERYHYVQRHHPEMLQRISLSQLSSYLGVARETLSRIRNKASK